MKGKIPRIVMVVVTLAMAMSLVAGVTTTVGAEKPGVDERWTGFTLPSEVGYQLFPGTEVGQLDLAADGTLIAAVYDETFNRWGSPRGTVLAAIFVSTDGGYYWTFGWELPEDDPGPVVDIVAAPGYEHPGTIYMVTETYLYWSTDGADSFYRAYTACPGVAGNPDDGIPGGIITSLDVASDADEPDEFVAVVGTDWGGLDGVYCWNIHGETRWQDMEITNRPAAQWDTGPEGVLEVAFSPNYPDDRIIYAVANYDPCILTPPWTLPSAFTTVITVYDGKSGTWGIEYMDAAIWLQMLPTSATGDPGTYARMAFFDDYDISASPYAVVAISFTNASDDVYMVKSLPPAIGPSTATGLDLIIGGGVVPSTYYSIEAFGAILMGGTVLVGAVFPPGSGQAQVYIGTHLFFSPHWDPSIKPPSGGAGMAVGATTGLGVYGAGIDVEEIGGRTFYVGTGENWGWSPSAVSVGRTNLAGWHIWNGVGLIDTIVVTTDVLGWTNWAAVVYEEVSPAWGKASPGDDTLYITTWKQGFNDTFVYGDIGYTDGGGGVYDGWFMFAIDHEGDVQGRFGGHYLTGNCTVPFSGIMTGTALPADGPPWTSIDGDDGLKVCAGDPVGGCCAGPDATDWSANITPCGQCSTVEGTMEFTIACDTMCDCTLTCSGAVAIAGDLCPHAYGVDLWRHAPTGLEQSDERAIVWERIAYESLVFMLEETPPYKMVAGLPATVTDQYLNIPEVAEAPSYLQGYTAAGMTTMIPRVHEGFVFDPEPDVDEFLFVLGGVKVVASGTVLGYTDQLFFSFDGGETVYYVSVMPAHALRIGAAVTGQADGPGMSDVGWDVIDDSTIIMGDISGYVFKTTNRGNSWTDGVDTATGLVTDIKKSPIYSEAGGEGTDQSVLVGLYNTAATAGQVWISQDGAEEQFVQVGKDIVDDNYGMHSKIVTNFDLGWGTESSLTNRFIYAGASGFLARYCCGCPSPQVCDEAGETGIYRTQVNVDNPSDSIWEHIYSFVDIEPLLPNPVDCAWMHWYFTDLEYGPETGTIYIPFGVYQWTGIAAGQEGTPNYPYHGNFAFGGVLRTLDGTKERVEWIGWDELTLGLPRAPYCGQWLVRAVPGTNYLFSISYQLDIIDANWIYGDPTLRADLADYDLGLVIYEDTLCQTGPDLISPSDDATNVGEIKGSLDEVNVILEWDKVESTALVTYEVQLDEDSKFNASEAFVAAATEDEAAAVGLVRQATTTEDFTAFADLENGFTYFWRVRVVDPALSPWSDTYSFTTTITGELGAPMLESPEAGAIHVDLQPTFEWSSVAWADTYALEVATDSAFSSTVIDEALSAQAYQPASDLEENTTYYWRVMGSSSTQDSNWSGTGIFTTGPPPADAGAGTPAWVWVVIVIGAILAIAVIVLIVRTRRPV